MYFRQAIVMLGVVPTLYYRKFLQLNTLLILALGW